MSCTSCLYLTRMSCTLRIYSTLCNTTTTIIKFAFRQKRIYMARSRNKRAQKRSLHHFRRRRVLLLLFRLQAKRIIFCKSDKKPDFCCNAKTMGKNDFIRPTFFIGVSLPMLNFKRAFFGPLYNEILPYMYSNARNERLAKRLVAYDRWCRPSRRAERSRRHRPHRAGRARRSAHRHCRCHCRLPLRKRRPRCRRS